MAVGGLASGFRNMHIQGDDYADDVGFRVAYVPEPTGVMLLFSAIVAVIVSRKLLAKS